MITNEQLIKYISILYNIVKDGDIYYHIFNYYMIFDNLSYIEKTCCDEINEWISTVDVEYGNAEGENRKLDASLLKEAFSQILNIINKYKFDIRIGDFPENNLTGFTLKESAEFTALQAENEIVFLRTIISEGFNNFNTNNITIIDFVRTYINFLLRNGVLLFHNNERCSDMELFLHSWQNEQDWKNSENWILKK